MASSTYSAAVNAHKRFDCSEAASKYGQLVGFYSLAITAHRDTAKERRAECRAVLAAETAAQERKHQSAAKLYEEILDQHASSPIVDKLRERRAEELIWWGDGAKGRAAEDPELFASALVRYDTVLVELGQTSQVETARNRVTDLWHAASSGRPCRRSAATLVLADGDYDSNEAQAVSRLAARKAPSYMLGCGNELIAAHHYRNAIRILRLLIAEFRGTSVASRARGRLIDAEVGQIRGGRTVDLPPPVIVGGASGGQAAITIENSGPYPLEILLSGPGSRRFTVPRCSGCKKFSSSSEVTSCPSGPTRTFVVTPGTYSAVVRDPARKVKPWAGQFRVDAGYRYDEGCFYVVSPLALPSLR